MKVSGAQWFGQCGNFRIFLPLRFYVKSILVVWKPQNLPIWPFEHFRILNFWELLTFSNVKFLKKIKIQRLLKWAQLISRKIRVAEEFCNFHTVESEEYFVICTLWIWNIYNFFVKSTYLRFLKLTVTNNKSRIFHIFSRAKCYTILSSAFRYRVNTMYFGINLGNFGIKYWKTLKYLMNTDLSNS